MTAHAGMGRRCSRTVKSIDSTKAAPDESPMTAILSAGTLSSRRRYAPSASSWDAGNGCSGASRR
jgi:hypothetical protein